jgi:hypothetical protein
MSQPRQNWFRFHDKPPSFATGLFPRDFSNTQIARISKRIPAANFTVFTSF